MEVAIGRFRLGAWVRISWAGLRLGAWVGLEVGLGVGVRGGRLGSWRPDEACETGKRGNWAWAGNWLGVWESGGQWTRQLSVRAHMAEKS